MDQNRPTINFGDLERNRQTQENDRTYSVNNERVYPTTPSTFPQSVFQPMHGGQQDYLNAGVRSPTGAAYPPQGQGYFAGAGYSGYASPTHYGGQQYQTNVTSPQGYSYQTLNTIDPNAGLANKFSAQNLGGQPRRDQFYGRQPSPLSGGSRPSTQQGYSSHLSPHAASSPLSTQGEKPPEQDPSRYSSNIQKRVIGLHLYVEKFFTDNITRARERNTRYVVIIVCPLSSLTLG